MDGILLLSSRSITAISLQEGFHSCFIVKRKPKSPRLFAKDVVERHEKKNKFLLDKYFTDRPRHKSLDYPVHEHSIDTHRCLQRMNRGCTVLFHCDRKGMLLRQMD